MLSAPPAPKEAVVAAVAAEEWVRFVAHRRAAVGAEGAEVVPAQVANRGLVAPVEAVRSGCSLTTRRLRSKQATLPPATADRAAREAPAGMAGWVVPVALGHRVCQTAAVASAAAAATAELVVTVETAGPVVVVVAVSRSPSTPPVPRAYRSIRDPHSLPEPAERVVPKRPEGTPGL